MTTLIDNTQWKKQAAQAVDDDAVEKAFVDQAYTFVSNKAGELMKDPYRLGFEIVHKDDANSRMVGIFAFRIAKSLLYAPVFFLNGEIKGTDLLYRCRLKRMVPLCESWVKFLIESDTDDIGSGVERSYTQKLPADVWVERLAHPPSNRGFKSASVGHMYKVASQDDAKLWGEIFDEMAAQPKLDPVNFREFLVEAQPTAVVKLANWLENYEFADALLSHVDVEDLCPEEVITKVAAEAAARAPKPVLTLHQTFESVPAEGRDAFFKEGFFIGDERPEKFLGVVYEDTPRELQDISEPGVYKVYTSTDKQVEAFVGRPAVKDLDFSGCCPAPYDNAEGYSTDPNADTVYDEANRRAGFKPRVIVVLTDGRSAEKTAPLGSHVKDISQVGDDWLEETASKGKCYRAFNTKTGELSRPFYVREKETKDGLVVYGVSTGWSDNTELKQNKDYNGTDFSRNILGSTARFVEVKGEAHEATADRGFHVDFDNEVDLSDATTLDDWIYRAGLTKMEIQHEKRSNMFLLSHEGQLSPRMSALGLSVVLTKDLGIHAKSASVLVDKTLKEGALSFFYELPTDAVKRAAALHVLNNPQFMEMYDGEFSKKMEIPQTLVINTEWAGPAMPISRIGDAYDPGMGHGPVKYGGDPERSRLQPESTEENLTEEVVMSSPPEMLGELAKSRKLPHVFDHGVVGSLCQTYDSVGQLDKWLPKLEVALDVMGKSLFLFYWKPKDWEEAYGSDDMANLENELLSNFKSFGDMTLNLLKKAKKAGRGSVSLSA